MKRTIKFLISQKINGKRQTVELFPEDEFDANDESIMVAFYIQSDDKFTVIPDATPAQVWGEWINQF